VDETFSVTVKPNLVAQFKDDGFKSIIVPGDTGEVKLRIGNSGASTLQGQFDVKFYLSEIDPVTDRNGVILDANDRLIGQVTNRALSIPGGERAIVATTLAIPSELLEGDPQRYRSSRR
jgi:hypothetical protein